MKINETLKLQIGASAAGEHLDGVNNSIYGGLLEHARECSSAEDFTKSLVKNQTSCLIEKGEELPLKGNKSVNWSKTPFGNTTYKASVTTIRKALEADVSLVDENGNPLGKTALDRARRDKFSDPVAKAKALGTQLKNHCNKHGLDPYDYI